MSNDLPSEKDGEHLIQTSKSKRTPAHNPIPTKSPLPNKLQPGKITISRMYCTQEEDFVKIQIMSPTHTHIVDVKMSLQKYAEATTGQGSIDCQFIDYRGR